LRSVSPLVYSSVLWLCTRWEREGVDCSVSKSNSDWDTERFCIQHILYRLVCFGKQALALWFWVLGSLLDVRIEAHLGYGVLWIFDEV
jgi:hypothetical protein